MEDYKAKFRTLMDSFRCAYMKDQCWADTLLSEIKVRGYLSELEKRADVPMPEFRKMWEEYVSIAGDPWP